MKGTRLTLKQLQILPLICSFYNQQQTQLLAKQRSYKTQINLNLAYFTQNCERNITDHDEFDTVLAQACTGA